MAMGHERGGRPSAKTAYRQADLDCGAKSPQFGSVASQPPALGKSLSWAAILHQARAHISDPDRHVIGQTGRLSPRLYCRLPPRQHELTEALSSSYPRLA